MDPWCESFSLNEDERWGSISKVLRSLPRTKIPNQTKHAPTSKTSYVQIIKMMPKKENRWFTCMNELMTNTGTPSLAYHNVFFQVQIYNLQRIMVFTYHHFHSTSFTWKKKNMLQHVFDSCQYFTKEEYFHNNQRDDKWISFIVTSVNKSHDRSLFNTDIPVGWAVLLSAMMIQLSVASCQPGLRQSLLQLSAPSAHRATEWAGWGATRNDTAIIQPGKQLWSENRQHFVKGCESWKEQRKVYSNEQYTEVWCCKLKIQSYSVCYVDEPVVKGLH